MEFLYKKSTGKNLYCQDQVDYNQKMCTLK